MGEHQGRVFGRSLNDGELLSPPFSDDLRWRAAVFRMHRALLGAKWWQALFESSSIKNDMVCWYDRSRMMWSAGSPKIRCNDLLHD